MTNSNISPRKAAIVAGFGLLLMTVFAIFATSFVFEQLVVSEDAAATARNILTNTLLFRLGISSLVIVILIDVIVAWALYVLLVPVNKSLSLLAAWFRVTYAAIFASALNNLFTVLHLVQSADDLATPEPHQLHAQIQVFIRAFYSGWDLGLVLFGGHLFVLGYVVLQAGYIPRILGILLIIAGCGYGIDSFGTFLLANYTLTISMLTFIGEMFLMVWLLWKGPKIAT